MAVLSMSKQEFSRLDVLLRVQSGRLRVSDACVLIAYSGVRYFVCCAGSSRMVPRACSPSAEANLATIGYPQRFALWRCRLCGSGTLTSARPWRRRSWQSITVARCHARPCAVG